MSLNPRNPRTKPRWLLTLGAVGGLLAAVIGVAAAALPTPPFAPIPPNFFTVTDSNGANDVPAQSDLTQMGRDDADASVYKLFWSWDEIDQWTGSGQTGDACALFDNDGDTKINFVVCARVSNPNADPTTVELVPQDTTHPVYLFSCSDAKNDRCTQPNGPLPYTAPTDADAGVLGTRAKDNLITGTDPFAVGSDNPYDSTVEVWVKKSILPDGVLPNGQRQESVLTNVCSYPSAGNGGNNNPFDCVVSPGGGFLVIAKDAGASVTSPTFDFAVTNPTETRSINGTGSTIQTPIAVPITQNPSTSVTETPVTNWTLQSISCKFADGATSTGSIDAQNPYKINNVAVQSGKITTCTFTNTRNQGSIELKKSWSGTAGQTTLNIGTSSGGSQVDNQLTGAAGAAPLTTGANTVNTGTYYISETGGLDNYSTTWACTKGGAAFTNGTGTTASVAVGSSEVIVCTFTNTRNQGSIEIVKALSPTDDPGRFNLLLDGVIKKTNAGNSDTTGALTVDTGTYGVSENTTGVTPATNIADYTTTYSCTKNGGALTSGSGTSISGLVVAKDDVVVCTFTNTRRTFTIITIVCEGSTLYSSDVTLGSETKESLKTSTDPTAAELCALTGARFTGLPTGTYSQSIVIGTSPLPN